MKKFIFLFVLLSSLIITSCSNENDDIVNQTQETNLQKIVQSQLEFLGDKTSLIIPPQENYDSPKVFFSPYGKEISMLKSLGFTVIQNNNKSSGELCGLGTYAAGREVGRITDAGGCAQVRNDPDNSGKYCVKAIQCQ